MASPNWWFHKDSQATPKGYTSGQPLWGCSGITVGGSAISDGIVFIVVGKGWGGSGCGFGAGLVNGKGTGGKIKTVQNPYIANMGGGNAYSKYESKRRDKGLPVCWDEQSRVVRTAFKSMIDKMNKDPWVSSVCGGKQYDTNGQATRKGEFAVGLENIGGDWSWCMSEPQTSARVLDKSSKIANRELCDTEGKKRYGGRFPNNLKSSECRALKDSKDAPCKFNGNNRSCDSNHAAGRAWDMFNSAIGMYKIPDPYYLKNWSNCTFARWMWMTENAHFYKISNISNEYWHWQYNDPIENPEEAKKLAALPSPTTETEPQTPTESQTSGSVVVNENTQVNPQVVDGEVNTDIDFADVEQDFYSYEEYKYNSLEAVHSTLPPLSIERYAVDRVNGLKYLSDDDQLLIIDRYKTAESVTQSSRRQTEFGENTDVEENIKENSPWSSAPPIEEKEKIKLLSDRISDLKNQKTTLDVEINTLQSVYDEYNAIINKGKQDDEIIEEFRNTPQFWDKIKNLQKNPEGDLYKTLETAINNGKPADEIMTSFNQKFGSLNEKKDKLNQNIFEAEKELALKTLDEELSRDAVDNRISNYLNSSGISNLFSSGNEENNVSQSIVSSSLKEFDLYDVGDQLQKFDAKLKKLTPPKLSDIQTILAGGLSAKTLLTALSPFKLPDSEELTKVLQFASDAEALYNSDLEGLAKTVGDFGAVDAINSWQTFKDLQSKVGPIIEEGKKLYESGSKIYEKGKEYAKKADDAYKTYQSLKDDATNAWKEGGKLWSDAKAEYENKKREVNQLLESAKTLPGKLRDEAIAKANELSAEADSKWKNLQKTGQDKIDAARKQYEDLKSKSEQALNEGKRLQNDPKVVSSNELQKKLTDAEDEVNNLKNTYSKEVIDKIESAAEKKATFDLAVNNASIAQKAAIDSFGKTNINREPIKHSPKDFKSFYDWVLQKENEVLNIEIPNDNLSVSVNNGADTTFVRVDGSPDVSPSSQENQVSVRVDGNISVAAPGQQSQLSPKQSSPFIIYRGATGKIQNPTLSQMQSGKYNNFGFERIPTQFNSYFDFGKSQSNPVNLTKLFDGYVDSIMSPIDVALLLNAGNVGMFNNVAPYGFGEGSELAAAVTFQKVVQKDVGSLFSKGGIGTEKQPNWAYNPEWAGLYVNFLLEENGIYQSDDKFLDFKKIRQVDRYVKNGEGIKLKNTAPLTDIPKSFPGAVIAYFDPATRKGHIEIMLRATIGGFITLGGNIKLGSVSKFGSTHGFRFYHSLKEFSPSNDVYIIKRGVKNNWTTNGRLDGRIKRTTALNEYMMSIEDTNSPKNSKLFAEAYNILRGNVSDSVFTRSDEVKLTDNNKISVKDETFKLHNYNDIYMSGSIDLNTYTFESVYGDPDTVSGGH